MRLATALLAGSLLATGAFAQCTVTSAGQGCGPVLTVTYTPNGQGGGHIIDVMVDGLDPAGIGLMIWGTYNFDVPIPTFSMCPLHTDALWGHFINADSTGHWDWQRSWPGSVIGGYYIQMGELVFDPNGDLDIHTSNCAWAECQ
ncbi:MAG: hypothetical protein R3F29_07275 [Planctomycetota bacterium]